MERIIPTWGLLLRREDYLAMSQHVACEAPLEACGLVAGAARQSQGVYPVPNVLRSPVRFRMAPEDQWRAMKTIMEQGLDILAIYHSHPTGPPWPSAIDTQEMAYPDSAYLIWAPIGQTWICRAYRWISQGFVEIPLRLT